jgi:hypothetical protein
VVRKAYSLEARRGGFGLRVGRSRGPDRGLERAVRSHQQSPDLGPVGRAAPPRPVRIGGRATIADLGGQTAQTARLGDRGLGDAVQLSVEGGYRGTGRFAGGEPDLAAHHPPAEFAARDLVRHQALGQAEHPIAANDVPQVRRIVA